MQQTITELGMWSVLEDLSPAHVAALRPKLEFINLAPGEVLFHQGDPSEEVYFVRLGTAEVYVRSADGDLVLGTVEVGDTIGEMAFIDRAARSASVRARTELGLFRLTRDSLNAVDADRSLTYALGLGFARAMVERLRTATTERVRAVEARLALVSRQNAFGKFVTFVVVGNAIGTLVNHLLSHELDWVSPYSTTFTWLYMIVLLVPGLVLIWAMKIPLRDLGVTLVAWKRSVVEALAVSAGLAVPFFAVLFVLRSYGLAPTKASEMDAPLWMALAGIPLYVVHSFLQEFLARGLIQTSLERFLDDRSGVSAVALTSLCFGLYHIQFGLYAVVAVSITSLLFGFFYKRSYNLIGVTVLHALVGVVALSSGFL